MAEIPGEYHGSVEVKADPETAFELVNDYPRSAYHHPTIQSFTKVRPGVYRWAAKPVGFKSFSLAACYEATYKGIKNKEVHWKSIRGKGNVDVEGSWKVEPLPGGGTRLHFDMKLKVYWPVPWIFIGLAKRVIEYQLAGPMDEYLQNIRKTLEKQPKKARKA